jgi:IS5 family transposase
LITDTTSLEKNIAFPTEIDLLGRVIEYGERIIQKVDRKAKLVKSGVIRKAKQTAKIFYSAGQKTKELLEKMSGRLLKMAVEQMAQAERIYQKASETVKKKLRKTYEALDTTGRKVIRQIRKKLAGENIPDRIVNFHESHVRALPKGKIHKPCEFGTKVRIDMTGNGYVTNYQNYLGNPNDATMTEDAVKAHAKKYGKEFKFATADRGFANREMEQRLEFQLGIKMVIPGKKESTSTLKGEEKKIYNSRAAIEAKISEGKRCVGLDKCLYHGYEGDQICTALGVFALNARKLMRDLRENPKLMMAFT